VPLLRSADRQRERAQTLYVRLRIGTVRFQIASGGALPHCVWPHPSVVCAVDHELLGDAAHVDARAPEPAVASVFAHVNVNVRVRGHGE
jgi:hypothetical protein